MSNISKNIFLGSLYGIGFMFCSGAIIQTFLLQIGFSESQIYLYNSLVQLVQVIVMFAMIFFSDKIKKVKWTIAGTFLLLAVLATLFLICALDPSLHNNFKVIAIFTVSAIGYVGVGTYNVLSYCLPYLIIDMKDYPKMTAFGCIFSGGTSFALSFLHTFIVAKFDYLASMVWFFVLALVCFITTFFLCVSLKELPEKTAPNTDSKANMLAVFKNKNTYFLIMPNFFRGVSVGILSVIAVIAISANILDEKTSSYVNVAMQLAMLVGNYIYIILSRKLSSKSILWISTVITCVLMPFVLVNNVVGFIILFFIMMVFRMITDSVIPVMVTEIIPQEQIGAYTSIRMLIFTGAQAIVSLLILPISNLVGNTGLLVFAAIMQLLCGLGYYLVAKKESA